MLMKKGVCSSGPAFPALDQRDNKHESEREGGPYGRKCNDHTEHIAPERAAAGHKLKMRRVLRIIGDPRTVPGLDTAGQKWSDIDREVLPIGEKLDGVCAGLRLRLGGGGVR